MQRGMVDYFMNLLNISRQDVWVVIKEACHSCVDKLDNNDKTKSWKYAEIPNCDIKLRIDVQRLRRYNYNTRSYENKEHYYADIKFSNVSSNEEFSDEKVEEYIVEKILLDLDEPEEEIC